jgi:quercetin dioxygenase-like cupin family protein
VEEKGGGMQFKRTWLSITMVVLSFSSLYGSSYALPGPRYDGLQQGPERLLETGQTVIGQPLKYPGDGSAKITAVIVTLAPGEQTKVHKHPVPLFGYVISGELEVQYQGMGTKRFAAGEGFMEAVEWWHKGKNIGDVPVRILAVYMGTEKLPNVIPKE